MLSTLQPNIATQIPTSKTTNTVVLNLSSTNAISMCNSEEFGGNFAILPIPANGIYTAKVGKPVWLKSTVLTQVWTEETDNQIFSLGTVTVGPDSTVNIAPGATVNIVNPVTVETATGVPISNVPIAPESIFSAELGGTAATLIAGVAGKSIYLHHIAYSIQSPDTSLVSPGVIQASGSPLTVLAYVNPSIEGQVIPMGGYQVSAGEGLDWLANSFPSGLTAYVTITYTLA